MGTTDMSGAAGTRAARKAVTLGELAEALGAELAGDAGREIRSAAPIDAAGPEDVSFVANPRYRSLLATTSAGAVILARGEQAHGRDVLYVDEPYLAFARVLELFDDRPRPAPGIHPTAVIGAGARLGERASVGPYAVVGERATIGADAVLHPHVVVYAEAVIGERFTAHAGAVVRERVTIGDDVVLQPGVVVGGDGFGFVPVPGAPAVPLRQIGTVSVGDGVDVGANTTIDRATVGATRVGNGVKLDNLVMIAHGCRVGDGTMLAAQFGMAGSSSLGAGVMAGGQVGVTGHVTVGDGVQIAGQAGVVRDVEAGRTVAGMPATDIWTWRRYSVALEHLPRLLRRVSSLERAREEDEAS